MSVATLAAPRSAAQRAGDMPPEARAWLEAMLREIARDAQARAKKSWLSHKAPMALYWKCVAVYARHLALVLAKAPVK